MCERGSGCPRGITFFEAGDLSHREGYKAVVFGAVVDDVPGAGDVQELGVIHRVDPAIGHADFVGVKRLCQLIIANVMAEDHFQAFYAVGAAEDKHFYVTLLLRYDDGGRAGFVNRLLTAGDKEDCSEEDQDAHARYCSDGRGRFK